ncbi:MAG: hypothetical protein PHG89_06730 [Gallionella sp.]|nr:hypothetical protein [Gallionella sp.]
MKKIVGIVVAVIVLILGGFFLNKSLTDKNEKEQKVALITQLKQQVTQDLKDPSSSQFRNVRYRAIPPEKGETTITHFLCGEINSKNSYGAYVGFKDFVSAFKTSTAMGLVDASTKVHMIDPTGNSYSHFQEGLKNLELMVLFFKVKKSCPAETEPILK